MTMRREEYRMTGPGQSELVRAMDVPLTEEQIMRQRRSEAVERLREVADGARTATPQELAADFLEVLQLLP
jgi:hypothetical protein